MFGASSEGPWEGAPKWVRVRDRNDIGKVIQPGKNLGSGHSNVYAFVVHFEETGEVCFYETGRVTRCDQDGNTEPN